MSRQTGVAAGGAGPTQPKKYLSKREMYSHTYRATRQVEGYYMKDKEGFWWFTPTEAEAKKHYCKRVLLHISDVPHKIVMEEEERLGAGQAHESQYDRDFPELGQAAHPAGGVQSKVHIPTKIIKFCVPVNNKCPNMIELQIESPSFSSKAQLLSKDGLIWRSVECEVPRDSSFHVSIKCLNVAYTMGFGMVAKQYNPTIAERKYISVDAQQRTMFLPLLEVQTGWGYSGTLKEDTEALVCIAQDSATKQQQLIHHMNSYIKYCLLDSNVTPTMLVDDSSQLLRDVNVSGIAMEDAEVHEKFRELLVDVINDSKNADHRTVVVLKTLVAIGWSFEKFRVEFNEEQRADILGLLVEESSRLVAYVSRLTRNIRTFYDIGLATFVGANPFSWISMILFGGQPTPSFLTEEKKKEYGHEQCEAWFLQELDSAKSKLLFKRNEGESVAIRRALLKAAPTLKTLEELYSATEFKLSEESHYKFCDKGHMDKDMILRMEAFLLSDFISPAEDLKVNFDLEYSVTKRFLGNAFFSFAKKRFASDRRDPTFETWLLSKLPLPAFKLAKQNRRIILKTCSEEPTVAKYPLLFLKMLPHFPEEARIMDMESWTWSRCDFGNRSFTHEKLLNALADVIDCSTSHDKKNFFKLAKSIVLEVGVPKLLGRLKKVDDCISNMPQTTENDLRDFFFSIIEEHIKNAPKRGIILAKDINKLLEKQSCPLAGRVLCCVLDRIPSRNDGDDQSTVSKMCRQFEQDPIAVSEFIVYLMSHHRKSKGVAEHAFVKKFGELWTQFADCIKRKDVTVAEVARVKTSLNLLTQGTRHLRDLSSTLGLEQEMVSDSFTIVSPPLDELLEDCEKISFATTEKIKRAIYFVESKLRYACDYEQVYEQLKKIKAQHGHSTISSLASSLNDSNQTLGQISSNIYDQAEEVYAFLDSTIYQRMWDFAWDQYREDQRILVIDETEGNVETGDEVLGTADGEQPEEDLHPPQLNRTNSETTDLSCCDACDQIVAMVQLRKKEFETKIREHSITIGEMEEFAGAANNWNPTQEWNVFFSGLDQGYKDMFDLFAKRREISQTNACIKMFFSTVCADDNNFGVRLDESDAILMAVGKLQECFNNTDNKLDEYILLSKQLFEISFTSYQHAVDLIKILGNESGISLLKLLDESGDDDLRDLQNAVEPDDPINEKVIRDLVNLKSTLEPCLRATYTSANLLLPALNALNHPGFIEAVKTCVQNAIGLTELYNGVANREANTMKKVESITSRGNLSFTITDNVVLVECHVPSLDQQARHRYTLIDLQDLRSRALLMYVSSEHGTGEDTGAEESKSSVDGGVSASTLKDNMKRFVKIADDATCIYDIMRELCEWGYINFHNPSVKQGQATFKTSFQLSEEDVVSDLACMKKELESDFEEWKEFFLPTVRHDFPVLSFFCSRQLWTLMEALWSSNLKLSLLEQCVRFVKPDLHVQAIKDALDNRGPIAEDERNQLFTTDCAKDKLELLGTSMNKLLGAIEIIQHARLGHSLVHAALEERVQVGTGEGVNFAVADTQLLNEGEICAVWYRETKPTKFGKIYDGNVVKTLLGVSQGTKALQRHQILFCNHQTTHVVELQAFLQRAMFDDSEGALFVIAGIDHLDQQSQHDLVTLITKFKAKFRKFRIALTHEGQNDCLKSISEVKRIVPNAITEDDLQVLLKERMELSGKDVTVITADAAGMGKTKRVYDGSGDRKVVTFPISGRINRKDIVTRFMDAALDENDCLHLELSQIHEDDLREADILMFEICVLGCVMGDPLSMTTPFFHIDAQQIMIEIANTNNGSNLRERLSTCKYFKHVNLYWDPQQFVIEGACFTDGQIVANYLSLVNTNQANDTLLLLDGNESPTLERGTVQHIREVPQEEYVRLFDVYLWKGRPSSFSLTQTFVKVLARQLKIFSNSCFYWPGYCDQNQPQFRTNVLHSLIESTYTFVNQSVDSAREGQYNAVEQIDSSAPDMAGIVSWENQDIVVVALNHDGAITLLYRDHSTVPAHIQQAYLEQHGLGQHAGLPDVSKATHDDLEKQLKIVVSEGGEVYHPNVDGEYVLTADNLLKMTLIWLRLQAGVPVVIMGETGVGKTSLLKYLAHHVPNVSFEVVNVHAGTSLSQIQDAVVAAEKIAEERDVRVWLFWDEINTNENIGLLEEIVCRQRICGRKIDERVISMAACNPYRKRKSLGADVGFQHSKADRGPMSQLVYRVYPLPDSLFDYVWDFGALTKPDQESYIRKMLGDIKNADLITGLVAASQEYISNPECQGCSAVSLRDVRRFKTLLTFFEQDLDARMRMKPERMNQYKSYSENKRRLERKEEISIVLAIAHCYHARLSINELRDDFCGMIAETWRDLGERSRRNQGTWWGNRKYYYVTTEWIKEVIEKEQKDFVVRMELESGTALNGALLENTFVLLVSILNRLPVFLVGKPGSSKSLSMELINSNLRGKDSKDDYFKTLPHIHKLGYQGSETARADGIERVFEKAGRYGDDRRDHVLPVILLDEIGLAEVSHHNPLKVLHALLETDAFEDFQKRGGAQLGYAVVGISNWKLDASKMNRAIYLARPDPSPHDLVVTAHSIYESINSAAMLDSDKSLLCQLAHVYSEKTGDMTVRQELRSFHGLRDFYSMVKEVATKRKEALIERGHVCQAVARNFSGLPDAFFQDLELIDRPRASERNFCNKVYKDDPITNDDLPPISALVQQNLEESGARHLMLITHSDSAISTLGNNMKNMEVMVGSRFAEDCGDDSYTYRVLSKIILCMETGRRLVLKGLDPIYGALYDMLNQHYTLFSGKRHCRVALGADSNPMCQVHDNFRCIVLTDVRDLELSDPPFLNRFEKQLTSFKDALSRPEKEIHRDMVAWSHAITTVPNTQWKRDLAFGSYSESTFDDCMIPSLVLSHKHVVGDDIATRCKQSLFRIMSIDAVARSLFSDADTGETQKDEIKDLVMNYFDDTSHANILETLKRAKKRTAVFTYTSVVNSIATCDGIQEEFLGHIKSERELEQKLKTFWSGTTHADKFVLHCDAFEDEDHLDLARHKMEAYEEAYYGGGQDPSVKKLQVIIIHLKRGISAGEDDIDGQSFTMNKGVLSFLSGWDQIMVEQLDGSLDDFKTICRLLGASSFFEEMANVVKINVPTLTRQALRAIRGLHNRERLNELFNINNVDPVFPKARKNLLSACQEAVLSRLQTQEEAKNETIVKMLACDITPLVESGSILTCLRNYLKRETQKALVDVIFHLEANSALSTLANILENGSDDTDHLMLLWERMYLVKDTLASSNTASAIDLSGPGQHYDGLKSPLSAPVLKLVHRHLGDLDDEMDNWENFREAVLKPSIGKNFAKEFNQILEDPGDFDKFFEPFQYQYCADVRSAFAEDLFHGNSTAVKTTETVFCHIFPESAFPTTQPLDMHFKTKKLRPFFEAYGKESFLRTGDQIRSALLDYSLEASPEASGFEGLIRSSIMICCSGCFIWGTNTEFHREWQQSWLENSRAILARANTLAQLSINADAEESVAHVNLKLAVALMAAMPNEALRMETFKRMFSSDRQNKVTSEEIREYLAAIDGEFDSVKARLYYILYEYADDQEDDHIVKILEESCALVMSPTGAGCEFPILLKAVENLLEDIREIYDCDDYGEGVSRFITSTNHLDLEHSKEYQFLSKTMTNCSHGEFRSTVLNDPLFVAFSNAIFSMVKIDFLNRSQRDESVQSSITITEGSTLKAVFVSVELLGSPRFQSSHVCLRALFASAFVRLFLSDVADVLVNGGGVIPGIENVVDAVENCCGQGANDVIEMTPIGRSLSIYFLRCLRHNHGIPQCDMEGVSSGFFEFFAKFPWPGSESACRLTFDPFLENDPDTSSSDQEIANAFNALDVCRSSRAKPDVDAGTFLRVIASSLLTGERCMRPDGIQRVLNYIDSINANNEVKGFISALLEQQPPYRATTTTPVDELLLLSLISQSVLLLPESLCPLRNGLYGPNLVTQTFMAAAPSDPAAEAIRLMRRMQREWGITAYYRCNNPGCGEIYGVGNCGLTSETSQCPKCKRDIGNRRDAGGHNAAANQEKLTEAQVDEIVQRAQGERGWGPHNEESLADRNFSIRNLNHYSFRVLHLVTNLSLIAYELRHGTSDRVNPYWDQAKLDLRFLQEISGLTIEELGITLHECIKNMASISGNPGSTLETAEDRAHWEARCQDEVLFRPTKAGAQELLQRYGPRNHVENALEIAINKQNDDWGTMLPWPKLFQVLPQPAISKLLDAAQLPSTKENFPFVSLAMERHKELSLVKHLRPLLQWPLLLRKHDWRFTRVQYARLSLDEFLSLSYEGDGSGHNAAEKAYLAFSTAFNEVLDYFSREKIPLNVFCDRYEDPSDPRDPHSFPLPPKMVLHDNSNARLLPQKAEIDEIDNVVLYAIIDKLAQVQNEILRDGDEILRDGDLSSSSTRTRPKVSVQALGGDQVSAQMLINVRPSRFWFDLLTQWNISGVENICKFAFGAQEEYLRESLAENKVFIKPFTRDSLLKRFDVKFKGEGFKTKLNLVQSVRQYVGNEYPMPNGNYVQDSDLRRDQQKVNDILSSLESVFLSIVNEAADFADFGQEYDLSGDLTLYEYCQRWMESECLEILDERMLEEVQLKHVIALYEVLEDMISERTVEGCAEQYKVAIDDPMKTELNDFCKFLSKPGEAMLAGTGISEVALEFMEATVRRFIRRYLVSPEHHGASLDPSLDIQDLFGEHFWSPATGIGEDDFIYHFPETLQLQHVFSTWKHILTKLEDYKEQRERGQQALSSSLLQPTTRQTAPRSRRARDQHRRQRR